jgi:hypothetical protein
MTAYAEIGVPRSAAKPSLRGTIVEGGLTWLLAGIAFVLALQFTMIFTRALNWDEFYHYSLVELFARGNVTQPLQTFFVRLFFWLPRLPGGEIDHVIAARLVMFGAPIRLLPPC